MVKSALPLRFCSLMTISSVTEAKAENSARTTYRPLAPTAILKVPSGSVEVMYFFPVSVLAALTVTPGRGTVPDLTKPLISPKAPVGLAPTPFVGVGDGSGDGCASLGGCPTDWVGDGACPSDPPLTGL